MTLRRGILELWSSADDSMLGQEARISFKSDALTNPAFLETSACRLHVEDGPANIHTLTDYLYVHIQQIGYAPTTTFYSWRGKFGIRIVREYGECMARAVMGLCPCGCDREFTTFQCLVKRTSVSNMNFIHGPISNKLQLSNCYPRRRDIPFYYSICPSEEFE